MAEEAWNIQSIYDLQYFICPSCPYKNHSKQEFVNHAYDFHSESEEYLKNIRDGSLYDIEVPFEIDTKPKFHSGGGEKLLEIKMEVFPDEIPDTSQNPKYKNTNQISKGFDEVNDNFKIVNFYCDLCDTYFCDQNSLDEHFELVHETKEELNDEDEDYIEDFVDIPSPERYTLL